MNTVQKSHLSIASVVLAAFGLGLTSVELFVALNVERFEGGPFMTPWLLGGVPLLLVTAIVVASAAAFRGERRLAAVGLGISVSALCLSLWALAIMF